MQIPLCDVRANYLSYKSEIDAAIARVIENSSYIMGKEVAAFENEYAEYCHSTNCIAVSNATDGLALALEAMDIGCGDEVIVPTFSVNASIECVNMVGANPVLCDCDDMGNITVATISNNVTLSTKAIIVVHMFGNAAEIYNIKHFAAMRNIRVIEDCSHAHGSYIHGKPAGTIGDIGVFSMFPSKVLGAMGDAGAIITDNDRYAVKIRALRDHGRLQGQKYTHEYSGYNRRMDGLQAAILRSKLCHLDEMVISRQNAAKRYDTMLPDRYTSITSLGSSHYVYAIRCNDRDDVKKRFKDAGIGCGVHYPVPLHKQPHYLQSTCEELSLPVSEGLSSVVLSLPMFPEITEAQQVEVIKVLKNET